MGIRFSAQAIVVDQTNFKELEAHFPVSLLARMNIGTLRFPIY